MKITLSNFKTLPLASLIPAPYSIRLPDPLLMKHLIKIIAKEGQLLPIYVREVPGINYEILPDSSNYIYNALVELGIQTAICFDCGKITNEQAQLLAAQHDLTKFEQDDLNLAEMLTALNKRYSTEQLYGLIPLNQVKIDAYLKLLSTDWNKLLAEDNEKREKRRLKKLLGNEKNQSLQLPATIETKYYKPLSPDSILKNY